METLWQHIVADFSALGSPAALATFVQVVMIDVLLAADNAIVVGALAAGLPPAMRRKVILVGVIAALILRIGFALMSLNAAAPNRRVGAGGRIAALWVAWKMVTRAARRGERETIRSRAGPRRFWAAAWAVGGRRTSR